MVRILPNVQPLEMQQDVMMQFILPESITLNLSEKATTVWNVLSFLIVGIVNIALVLQTREIKKKYEGELLRKGNVLGVMTGYKIRGKEKTDELSVICMVEKKLEKDKAANG